MDLQSPGAPPKTLLFHDGELADVRALLGDLDAPFVERRGSLLAEDRETSWGVIVGTPQRILEAHLEAGESKPTQIAVCDRDSRTLRNSLRRAGIQLMVRRPVHPAALRALLLHALYRGPEKRRSTRVSIGAPIRFRSGWRQRPAILADLSIGGCRLLTDHCVEPGKSFTLLVPADVGAGKAFQVKARAIRSLTAPGPEPALSARFEALKPKQIAHLKRTIAAHVDGPATIEAGASEAPEIAPAPTECESFAATPVVQDDQRDHPRHSLDRRVIALGQEATRVLMGRDLSPGGMRVNPNPLLAVGDDVRLAIHGGQQNLPLVVTAKVHRDEGERGIVLRFHELAAAETKLLNGMLDALPVVDHSESNRGVGMIVSEILGDPAEAAL